MEENVYLEFCDLEGNMFEKYSSKPNLVKWFPELIKHLWTVFNTWFKIVRLIVFSICPLGKNMRVCSSIAYILSCVFSGFVSLVYFAIFTFEGCLKTIVIWELIKLFKLLFVITVPAPTYLTNLQYNYGHLVLYCCSYASHSDALSGRITFWFGDEWRR